MTRPGVAREILTVVGCAAALIVPMLVPAQETPTRSVDYLPRNEILNSMSTPAGYSNTLPHIICTAAASLSDKIDRCQQCVLLKSTCPDCCLSHDMTTRKCTQQDDATLYTCLSNGVPCNVTQMFTNCSAAAACPTLGLATDCNNSAIPNCLELGCPSGQPALPVTAQCVRDTVNASTWICTEQDPTVGCAAGCPLETTNVANCSQLTYAYTVVPKAPPCPASLNTTVCYEYTPVPGLTSCIDQCVAFSRAKEQYDKNVYCCLQGVCCPELGCSGTTSGADQHCQSTSCESRMAWPECQPATYNPELCCNSLTADICSQWTQELDECASGGGSGACRSCYREIDSTFRYGFVAKGNEKIVVMWSMEAHPSYSPASAAAPNTFFYTMVQVVQEDTGAVVHQSIAHERSFTGAFSIFSATSIDQPDVLYPGKRYSVQLFYFMPALVGYTLTSQVSSMELTVLRVKE